MDFKIVADSSANLYAMEGVAYDYVPLKIGCDGREFVDGPELDIQEMNDVLRAAKAPSSTSCPNVYDWLEAFGGADEVFALTITGSLSGSYAAAENAARVYMEEHPGKKVSVIDSLSAGPEICLLMEKIRQYRSEGKLFEEIDAAVREYAKRTRLVFCLKSLNNLAKNGRVSAAKAKIAGVLNIHVVGKASDHGTLEPLHNCRGQAKSLSAILQVMRETGYKGGKVRIAHCFNPEAAEKLKALITEQFSNAKVLLEKTGGLCSYYAEEGGLMVGYECI